MPPQQVGTARRITDPKVLRDALHLRSHDRHQREFQNYGGNLKKNKTQWAPDVVASLDLLQVR